MAGDPERLRTWAARNCCRPGCVRRADWTDSRQSGAYPALVHSGDWERMTIDGVLRKSLDSRVDERGSFRELWRESWTGDLTSEPFVQANLSSSVTGVLRGLHFHLRQTDLWIVVGGAVHVALVDIRALLGGDDVEPTAADAKLSVGECLLIPAGVAHGFWALEPLDLIYLVTNEYDDTDEHSFRWDDPTLQLHWPSGRPTLSARDASAPSLAQAIARASNGRLRCR
jgi:dTDP-4-dehydrorhamnose 3,5-epimerase